MPRGWSATLREVKSALLKIKEQERTVAKAEWVAGALPVCDHKTQILRLAAKYAAKWVGDLTRKDPEGRLGAAQEMATRLQKEEMARTTELQLRRSDLAAFVPLIENPNELVCQMYSQVCAKCRPLTCMRPVVLRACLAL